MTSSPALLRSCHGVSVSSIILESLLMITTLVVVQTAVYYEQDTFDLVICLIIMVLNCLTPLCSHQKAVVDDMILQDG